MSLGVTVSLKIIKHKWDSKEETCMEMKVLLQLINIKPVFSYVPPILIDKG